MPDKPLIVDLHCHSTASDGTLPPAGVLKRAAEQGVDVLALTDHDSTAGLDEAQRQAVESGVQLIPGIEISTTWQGKLLHIIGLNIDPDSKPLQKGLGALQDMRDQRAHDMGLSLKKKAGIEGAEEAARELAGTGMVTRTHFARFLINAGIAKDMKQVFKRYLVSGKPGYSRVDWVDVSEAIEWINGSGGCAVLAHPLRYRLTANWLNRVLTAFCEQGGIGMEVVCGNHTVDDTARAAVFARKHGLQASVGSDFHDPGPWIELGRLGRMPDGLQPVWQQWL
ncbi:MAG TPA: phosphatase [Gammaproteobacteria bacterium]|nr:phosphatase [Gammaproteobacteria bacterium]